MLPLFKRGGKLFVGTSNPTHALDEIKFHTNLVVEPILVDEDQIRRTLEQWHASHDAIGNALGGDDEGMGNLDVAAGDEDLGASTGDSGIDAKGDDTPVVKFVNKVLVDAIRKGASDIHFEPYEDDYRVRLRIDGLLKMVARAPVKLNQRIAARLKVMAQLDIAESACRRTGASSSTCPRPSRSISASARCRPCSVKGGAAYPGWQRGQAGHRQTGLRAGPAEAVPGCDPQALRHGAGDRPHRFGQDRFAVYRAGHPQRRDAQYFHRRRPGGNPPARVNQVQQNNKRGMTFAAALRSFLRQDPDIIMVGEIRDLETAEIAIKAAQTGHMVLSTLHTNDAPQTIARLMNMGIAPYNITSSVTLVIAQRLARRLCPNCKRPANLPEHALLAEGFTQAQLDAGIQLYEAVGCDECTEGYKGRTGIYQVMPMTDEIATIVLAGGNALQIAEAAQQIGVNDLRQSALMKAAAGITSLAEINRVTKD